MTFRSRITSAEQRRSSAAQANKKSSTRHYRRLVAILLSSLVLGISAALIAGIYRGATKLATWQAQRERQAGVGVGTAPPPALHGHATPPQNMRDLAQQIAEITPIVQGHNKPIEFVQIGEQDYLILIGGTQLESTGGNNVESAVQAVTRQLSPYQRQVHALITQHIPRGSTLHFAGHSLGGMVANTLAITPEFLEHYRVKTVTTFAAPVNACPNREVVYHRYVVEGDLVPLVHKGAIWSRLKGPLGVLESECTGGYTYLEQQLIDHSPGPNGMENAHSSYEQSQDLIEEALPFLIDRYESRGRFKAVP